MLWIALFAFLAAPAEQKRLGAIDFFGYAGMDVESVRRALPFDEGDAAPEDVSVWQQPARDAVLRVTGRPATDVATACCDGKGRWVVYIGLPGSSSIVPEYRAAPTGSARLPRELTLLEKEYSAALFAAAMKSAREEDSTGYSLAKDPALRTKQLELRQLALRHEKRVYKVLATSSDAEQRAFAAIALGYANQTDAQIGALVRAASDPEGIVRNNAARALMVLAGGRPKLRGQIPPGVFIDLVRSGTWTDRNKGGAVLLSLTERGNPRLLAELRSRALEALVEMARWKSSGHADPARVLLGRIAGIEEQRLRELVATGRVDAILEALEK